MAKRKQTMAVEAFRQLLDYDSSSGHFHWRKRSEDMFPAERFCRIWNTRFAGKPALNIQHHAGYLYGEVMGTVFSAHRAAWFHTHGAVPDEIDHINGKRTDNRLENLREVTRQENCRNTAIRSRGTSSGQIGISWHAKGKRWLVRIGSQYIGLFKTMDEAIVARKAAEASLGYHPNHGRKGT